MRTLTLELYDDVDCKTVRKEISDTAIKQCAYGKPFDLLAEIQALGNELNARECNETM